MTTLAPVGNNISPNEGWLTYLPILTGATDNPVVTTSAAIGRFHILGAALFLYFRLVSTTMTKTTLTDLVQLSLPVAAATVTGAVAQGSARVENGTAVANMSVFEIASAAQVMNFRNYALAASSSQLTYAVTTPGIGVLTNTITFNGEGFYEYAAV